MTTVYLFMVGTAQPHRGFHQLNGGLANERMSTRPARIPGYYSIPLQAPHFFVKFLGTFLLFDVYVGFRFSPVDEMGDREPENGGEEL